MKATSTVAHTLGRAVLLDPSVIRRWVEQSCAEQGLPFTVTDLGALDRIAVLFGVQSCGHVRQADA